MKELEKERAKTEELMGLLNKWTRNEMVTNIDTLIRSADRVHEWLQIDTANDNKGRQQQLYEQILRKVTSMLNKLL